MFFCSLTKGITPIICRLRFCVIINKRSFEPFMCLDLVNGQPKCPKHMGPKGLVHGRRKHAGLRGFVNGRPKCPKHTGPKWRPKHTGFKGFVNRRPKQTGFKGLVNGRPKHMGFKGLVNGHPKHTGFKGFVNGRPKCP